MWTGKDQVSGMLLLTQKGKCLEMKQEIQPVMATTKLRYHYGGTIPLKTFWSHFMILISHLELTTKM